MQKSFTIQPKLFVSASDLNHPILRSLDDTKALLKRSEIGKLLSSICASNTGRLSYPLLTLFRALLLGTWYRLSDVQLAQCLYILVAFQVATLLAAFAHPDHLLFVGSRGFAYLLPSSNLKCFGYRYLLFCKFCHLELGGAVPEASTLGRFRTQLVEHRLWDQLLADINRQIEAKNIIMSEGRINIIDATPIEAARSGSDHDKSGKPTKDPEASWHVKNDSRGNKKSTYGFSVHTGVDEDGFIHRQSVTPDNVHDSQERDTLLLGDETALYARRL
ncbi:MAG: transposase [Candidatus Endonucleobacter sp. (ex Gigantidas childressi)]|nr:transposase [Candidatus Endonucleobacter sp. (ex Gigantidas childressi)]